MRQTPSDARKPGMIGHRRCSVCLTELTADDTDRCIDCRPRLSDNARAIEKLRREKQREMDEGLRQLKNLEGLIKKLDRKTRP